MAVDCTFNLGGAFVTLAGVALGGIVGFFSARHVSERNARATACAKFRSAYSPAYAYVSAYARHRADDPGRPNAAGFLSDSFVSHAAAIEEFRPFVLAKNMDAYQKAWDSYCELEPTLWAGAMFMAEGINSQQPHAAVLEKILAIMSFAKT